MLSSVVNNVVVVCISGFRFTGDPKSGVIDLRDDIIDKLTPLGIPSNNIFHRPWNNGNESDPGKTPDHWDINREIENRSKQPIYLALVGHSFGGWAACRVSRHSIRIPDFIALLDPVFGVDNWVGPDDKPRGKTIINWCQDNGIEFIGSHCFYPLGVIPCTDKIRGLACGNRNVPGATLHDVEYLMNRSGNVEKQKCGVFPVEYKVKKKVHHTSMDHNLFLHELIINKIYKDVKQIIEIAKMEEFQTILTLMHGSK
jgi:hypothetical protein